MSDSHWIEHAKIKKGALHRALGVPQGQKIPAGKLSAARKRGGRIGRMANLAKTLGRMHHANKLYPK